MLTRDSPRAYILKNIRPSFVGLDAPLRKVLRTIGDDRMRRQARRGRRYLGQTPPIHWEAWHQLKGWYWVAVDHAPLPTWVTLERITEERVYLYRYIPPLGANITISVEPFPVDGSVPTEDEIEWVVK